MSTAPNDCPLTDLDQEYAMNSSADPKNMQELTIYVSCALWVLPQYRESPFLCLLQVQNLLQNVQDKFQTMSDQIISRIDDMGTRIDDLEKSISDLMNQAGVEGGVPDK